MNKLKTLDDYEQEYSNYCKECEGFETSVTTEFSDKLKKEAIKLFKNLQSQETIYPILLRNFPETSKGSIAKKMWDDDNFRYGSEYGMLAMLMYFFNITDDDVKNVKGVSDGS